MAPGSDRVVVVATSPGDLSADRVVLALERHPVTVLRVDPAQTPAAFHYRPGQVAPAGALGGVPVDAVTAVYWRRPTRYRLDHPDPRLAAWSRREHDAGLRAALWSLPVTWVNHPRNNAATTKPDQITAAARLGLAVPETLITDDPEQAREFVSRFECITKTFTGSPAPEPGDVGADIVFTQPVSADEIDDSVAVTAHMFQQRIAAVHDLRVTVVGGDVFAAQAKTTALDWRTERPEWEPVATELLPGGIAEASVTMCADFGLMYGALDFARDDKGRCWFYELNPNGQFGFVTQRTGLPIAEAIAARLAA